MKLILCEGDSWTSGDLMNPELDETYINHPNNDSYRLPKVWPHKLSKLLGVEVCNNSQAGSSNDAIVRRTTEKVLSLLNEYKSEDLFVIVGWSSPERREFFYNDNWETLYPAQLGKRDDENLDKLYNIYVEHFWNTEEYISRFINQNLYLHYFLKSNNIKHLFFESFWEQKTSGMYVDNDIVDMISKDETNTAKHFLKIKDEIYKPISFRRFIMRNFSLNKREYFNNHHPTEKSHQLWSEELYKDLKNA